jgi:hypothetical protein
MAWFFNMPQICDMGQSEVRTAWLNTFTYPMTSRTVKQRDVTLFEIRKYRGGELVD